jgi:histidyl-tRNA synthetase
MKFQSVKGMDDLLSPEVEKWQALEEVSRKFFEAYGFREVRTPIVEHTDLFARSIGEASDIVHKEMYSFQDRGKRDLTLRPEMTASVVRAALQHNLIKEGEPSFVYYLGPMFRAERPQAGRRRQFHQIGVETLNTHSAVNDGELLVMIGRYLSVLGLKKFEIKLNHLGSAKDRQIFVDTLKQYFAAKITNLCKDCKYRLPKNILRIFDCKNKLCQTIIDAAPKHMISNQAESDLKQIMFILDQEKFPYKREPKLVRGLDYYTGLVFEVIAEGLGAQDAVLAGGRYDELISGLGGPQCGASGFSIGVERLLTSLQHAGVSLENQIFGDYVYVAALASRGANCSLYREIASALFRSGKRAHFSFSKGSLKNHLKKANKMKVKYAAIVGEDEFEKNEVSVKNMETGVQKRFKLEELSKAFMVNFSGESC